MKNGFIHTADLHIYDKHIYSVQNSRLEKIKENLMAMIRYAIDNEIKLIVIAGDIMDVCNPNENSMKVLSWFLTTCYKAKIMVRAITGDHDTNGVSYSVDSLDTLLKAFKNDLIKIYKTGTVYERIDDIDFVFIPFQPDQREAILKAKRKSTDKSVLITHVGVNKAMASSGKRISNQVKVNDLKIWDYVGLGDYHKMQHMGYNVYYSGSIIRINSGERDDKKGFIHVKENLKPKRVNLVDIDMINVAIDYDEIIGYSVPEKYGSKIVKDAIIFLTVCGSSKTNYNLSSISGKFYKAGAAQVIIHTTTGTKKKVNVDIEPMDMDVIEASKDFYMNNKKVKDEDELSTGLNYLKE